MVKTVGIIDIKDENSGSYRYLHIVSYEGETFADLERTGACSEYIIDRRAKIQKIITSGTATLAVDELGKIAKEVYGSVLYKKPYVTRLEFKLLHGELKMRTSSVRDGSYGAVDIGNALCGHGVYLSCSAAAGKGAPKMSVAEASALCDSLNICINRILQTEFMLYYPCMGAVYCDVDLFLQSPLWRRAFKGAVKPLKNCFATVVKLKSEFCKKRVLSAPRLKTAIPEINGRETAPSGDFYRDALAGIGAERVNMLKYVSEKLGGRFASPLLVSDVMTLPYDSGVSEINSRTAKHLRTLGKHLVSHGWLPDERFAEFLTCGEILRSFTDAKYCADLKNISAARLGNSYFHKEPPTLFNCCLQAFDI